MNDVILDFLRCRCRECQNWRATKSFGNRRERQIVGPEVVSPLTYAMGFIDHEKTDVMDAATARGCGKVMAKGQFANALPRLLGDLLPPAAA